MFIPMHENAHDFLFKLNQYNFKAIEWLYIENSFLWSYNVDEDGKVYGARVNPANFVSALVCPIGWPSNLILQNNIEHKFSVITK